MSKDYEKKHAAFKAAVARSNSAALLSGLATTVKMRDEAVDKIVSPSTDAEEASAGVMEWARTNDVLLAICDELAKRLGLEADNTEENPFGRSEAEASAELTALKSAADGAVKECADACTCPSCTAEREANALAEKQMAARELSAEATANIETALRDAEAKLANLDKKERAEEIARIKAISDFLIGGMNTQAGRA